MSEERKKAQVLSVQVEPTICLSKIIDINRFSSLGKLLRVTAYVRRFVNNIKGRMTSKGRAVERLEVEEIDQAENSDLPVEAKYPIILPQNGFAELVVWDVIKMSII